MQARGGRAGGDPVTRRQAEVLGAVGERLTNAEIATRLGVSERTIESHVSALLRRLGVSDRVALAQAAQGAGCSRGLPVALELAAERDALLCRDVELALLLQRWAQATWGCTLVSLVAGEPGVGKTRLVAELARRVHADGGGVLLGASADGVEPPYQPLLEALGPRVHERFLAHADDPVAAINPVWAQAQMQSMLIEELARLTRTGPILLVLEDLHWASLATHEVLRRLARLPPAWPLLVVGTMRTGEGFDGEPLLVPLARLPGTEVLNLAGLDERAIETMLTTFGSDIPVGQAMAETDGNPLLLRELATSGRQSPTLRQLVHDRFARLDADAAAVLDAAVVAGSRIEPVLLATALGRELASVIDALDRAAHAGLVTAATDAPYVAFAHDLFRSVRYEAIEPWRRVELHAAVARALACRQSDPEVLAQLARHACLGAPAGDARAAIDLANRAGNQAMQATDFAGAVEHHRRAVSLIDLAAPDDESLRLRTSVNLGRALMLAGDTEGPELLNRAAERAGRHGDGATLADALCGMSRQPGGSVSTGRVDPTFVGLADQALKLLPRDDDARRVRLTALLGGHLLWDHDSDAGQRMLLEALDRARALGEPVLLGEALLVWRFCGGPFDVEQRIACGRELIDLGRTTGVRLFAVAGREQLWWCSRELGNLDESRAWYEEAAAHLYAPDLEQRSHIAALALLRGDLRAAEQQAHDIDDSGGKGNLTRVYASAILGGVARLRGQFDDQEFLERAIRARPGQMDLLPRLGLALARSGQVIEAAAQFAEARERGFEVGASRPTWRGWLPSVVAWSETSDVLGDRDAAAELAELVDPLAGRLVDEGVVVMDSVDRVRALLALVQGQAADAEALALAAVVRSEERDTPVLRGRELVVLARAQRELGAPATSLAPLATAAHAITLATGARLIDQELDRHELLSLACASDGLTRREQEVIDALATGASNRQIARDLHISEGTVRKHLEHAYAKLGVSTRTAAVTRAGRPPAVTT